MGLGNLGKLLKEENLAGVGFARWKEGAKKEKGPNSKERQMKVEKWKILGRCRSEN